MLIYIALAPLVTIADCRLASSRDNKLYKDVFERYNKNFPPLNDEGKVRFIRNNFRAEPLFTSQSVN